jgi:hypothetical protein
VNDERAFRDKWRAPIDGCGTCCGCLIIFVAIIIAFFDFVIS